MLTPSDVAQSRETLDKTALDRWNHYAGQREAKDKAVDRDGVLAAAGAEHAARRMSHTSVVEGRVFEGIVGGDDTDLINFLTRGWRAGRSVARIMFGTTPIGTGFLVAPGLLISNAHVLPTARDIAGFEAEFDFERDADDVLLAPVRFALQPERLFVASPQDKLDFALVGIAATNRDGTDLARFGWLPLDERRDKILEGEPVVVIQHPLGREKRVCLFNSELKFRAPDAFIQYTTDTELGSSGSPAFNRQWQLVGLHHASVPSGKTERGTPEMVNEGIRISAIVAALRATATGAAPDPLAEDTPGSAKAALAAIEDPRTLGDGRPTAPLAPVPPAAAPELEGATVIRRRSIADYADRTGYDPEFLGVTVPLPLVPDFLADDIADVAGTHDKVLRYTHYSVVMSKARRLAYFAVANLDGTTLDPLNGGLKRTDRNPDSVVTNESAADVWYFDPRVDEAFQLTPEIYDRTRFDFGHLVRRLDPVWGDARTKRIANDDSFHITNCAPQHESLNRKSWSNLEDAAYTAAQKNGQRLIVLTGPVLDPRDPLILGVATPTAYWKIVAWVEQGALVARGFIQWQVRLVDEVGRAFEGLSQLDKAEAWRRPVRDIARLTGLDFGPLMHADDTPPGGAPLTDDTGRTIFP